ncbi:MAG: glycosyltransferase family 2 protein [Acidobacteria bacterium]|nr:glycosyltransferase family 2 protein [Acidobacteriota bacterium]
MKISAVIITLNEERNLRRALSSVSGVADEVVVVDSGSTDLTHEIAVRGRARFIKHVWEGYARQKNFAAAQAAHDWVLSLDADEALSPALIEEIRTLKQFANDEAAGYSMPRLPHYCGRWIRHSGWYPDRKVRLYDRRRACWVGEYVHESVVVDGEAGALRGDLLHYTCDTIEQHRGTVDRYTTLAAQEAHARGTRGALTRMILLPPWKFLETYLLRAGFLDGAAGLTIARMAAYYVYLKYAKLRRLQRPG